MNALVIRPAIAEDSEQIAAMIGKVFVEYNAAGMLPEGRAKFLEFIHPNNIRQRLTAGACMFIACHDAQIVGAVEVRIYSHIALLFTARHYQRKGIAKKLLEAAVARCKEKRPQLTAITVNSSAYAVPVYEQLGFIIRNKERLEQGVRYTPMVLPL
ncbi:acetyltransferase (GNAT) family protein [Anaerospora hongkongensis]|uniref:Acetyltransferase (GNAT) family protein n=2 Tax=Anaerospora hongkongensis TaxID=244830 RepID=A0A4R1PZN1_9FIRM|nr:GNAT family N-acetyltransferase [Anaerospora hongkongensis]TCL37760.1 acetyltransferase (GNAT) family protein [Anaerospora hongkongensis]